jgi:hypothetical protein
MMIVSGLVLSEAAAPAACAPARKPGRPREPHPVDATVTARVTAPEREAIEIAADDEGVSVSEYVRDAAVERTQRSAD